MPVRNKVILMNRANVALVLSTLSWGLSLTTADLALTHLSAADLLFLETATGTALVVGLCLITGRRLRGAWRPAFALGSLEPGIAYLLANLGLALTSAAVGSMLFALESVFVVLIAWAVLRNSPRRAEAAAVLLGLLGTVLVATAKSGGESTTLGVTLMVMSTVTSASYVFATRRFATGHEPLALVARQGIASLLVTSPFMMAAWAFNGSRIGTAPAGALLLAGASGVFGFAVPFTLWTVSLPHVRPGFAAAAINLTPLFGVLSGTLIGHGRLTGGQWAGGGLILG